MSYRNSSEYKNALKGNQAHDWGSRVPKVGDRVINISVTGTPVGGKGKIAEVRQADSHSDAKIIRIDWDGRGDILYGFWQWRVKPAPDDHLMSIAPLTRGGHLVLSTDVHEDHIQGLIRVGGRELSLRYDRSGHFMSDDNPIDLVNS